MLVALDVWSVASGMRSRLVVVFTRSGWPVLVCAVVLATLGLAGRAYGAQSAIRGAHRGDESGTAIAGAGDVNGDHRGDLLISTPGTVSVVFGRRNPATIRLGRLGKRGFRIVGSRDLGSFYGSVAGVGDVNGDDLADVLVSNGSHGYVVFGKRDSATVDLARLGAGGYELDGDVVGVAGAGDVNGDGRPDFLVQTVDTGGLGGPPGAARVVFGQPPGDPVVAGAPTGFDLVSHDDSDAAGGALAGAGDLNGDGLADVIVGAPNGGTGVIGNDGPQGDFSGRVYVVFGKRDGAPVDLQNLADQGFTIVRSASGEDGGLVGDSVAGVGDVNGDGRPDLVQSGNQSDAAVIFGGERTGTLDTRQLGSAGFVIRRSRAQAIISVAGLGDATGDESRTSDSEPRANPSRHGIREPPTRSVATGGLAPRRSHVRPPACAPSGKATKRATDGRRRASATSTGTASATCSSPMPRPTLPPAAPAAPATSSMERGGDSAARPSR